MRPFDLAVLALCVAAAAPRAAAAPAAKPSAAAVPTGQFPVAGNVTFAELSAATVEACPEAAGFYDNAESGNFTSYLSAGILSLAYSLDLPAGALVVLAPSDAAFAAALASGALTQAQLADPEVAGELIAQHVGVAAGGDAPSAAIANVEPDAMEFFVGGAPASAAAVGDAVVAGGAGAGAEVRLASTGQRARVLTVGGCPEAGLFVASVDTLLLPKKYAAAAAAAAPASGAAAAAAGGLAAAALALVAAAL
jgi:hypothetical protein